MKNGLENVVESFFIQLFRAHPLIKGKHLRHFDENRPAESNCITVEAIQGDHRLDGPRGYDVEVTVTYRSPAGVTQRQNNIVAGAIDDAVRQARPRKTAAEREFSYLLILDDTAGSRDNKRMLRQYEQKFNIIAKLKTQPENEANVVGDTVMTDTTALINGQPYLDVTFPVGSFANANWSFVNLSIENIIDADPLGIGIQTITMRTAAGFRVLFSGAPDSSNYVLRWGVTR